MIVYAWGCNVLPTNSACRRQRAIVRVGDSKRASAVAVVDVGAVLGGGGRFFGEAHQDGVVEFFVVVGCFGVLVDSL